MGLLDKLWDDTLAGPRPDTGLGRLRKFSTFAIRTDLSKESEGMNATGKSGPDSPMSPAIEEEETPRVTRSIMIRRPAGSASTAAGGSPPVSPAGSTPPVSPFLGPGSLGREWRFRRRSMSDAYERRSTTAPPTPTGAAAAAGASGVGSRRPNTDPFDV